MTQTCANKLKNKKWNELRMTFGNTKGILK